jgi:hypothetical protein
MWNWRALHMRTPIWVTKRKMASLRGQGATSTPMCAARCCYFAPDRPAQADGPRRRPVLSPCRWGSRVRRPQKDCLLAVAGEWVAARMSVHACPCPLLLAYQRAAAVCLQGGAPCSCCCFFYCSDSTATPLLQPASLSTTQLHLKVHRRPDGLRLVLCVPVPPTPACVRTRRGDPRQLCGAA